MYQKKLGTYGALFGMSLLVALWPSAASHPRSDMTSAPETLHVVIRSSTDTLRFQQGDTLIIKFAIPAAVVPGRYWLQMRGPNMITQLPYKGVVVITPRPN